MHFLANMTQLVYRLALVIKVSIKKIVKICRLSLGLTSPGKLYLYTDTLYSCITYTNPKNKYHY